MTRRLQSTKQTITAVVSPFMTLIAEKIIAWRKEMAVTGKHVVFAVRLMGTQMANVFDAIAAPIDNFWVGLRAGAIGASKAFLEAVDAMLTAARNAQLLYRSSCVSKFQARRRSKKR